MSNAEDFFYEYAGWSYTPASETPEQGRQRSAERLAAAERYATEQGWSVDWSDDWDSPHDEECYTDGGPETCEFAVLRDKDDNILDSLGCIDDADDNYRRVIEAEMALDAMLSAQGIE